LNLEIFRKRMNKKGNAFDVIYIMMILFLMAVVTLIAVTVYNAWDGSGKVTSSTGNIALQKANTTLTALDGIFAFVIVMLFILVIISSFMINTHPAFFVVTLILLIIAIILAVQFSNIYEQISEGELEDESSRYSIMSYMLDKLPFIIAVIIITIAVVLYAKAKQ